MNSNSFFDMLNELDDDIITEASVLPVKKVKKKGEIRTFLLIAACITALIVSGFILSDSIKTGNISVYETTFSKENTTVISDNTTLSPEEYTTVNHQIQETEITQPPTSNPTTEVPPATEDFTDEPITQIPSTSEITTSVPDTTENYVNTETEKPSEETTRDNNILNILSPFIENLFPSMGDTLSPPDSPGYFFIDVPAVAFYENLPEESFDKDVYGNTQSVPWHTLEEVYGTKIIPDINSSSGNATLDSTPDYEIYHEEHTVHYNDDKTAAFASQEFIFKLSDSMLTVKVSTDDFPKFSAEERYKDSRSLINDIPVLLLSSKVFGKNVFFDAVFEKDGVYFRISQRGTDLKEDLFIDLIKSVIQ